VSLLLSGVLAFDLVLAGWRWSLQIQNSLAVRIHLGISFDVDTIAGNTTHQLVFGF
jgi:hypothetical protein